MTTAETRSCTVCKEQFIVTADDFGFYEKMEVQAPNICPECRFRRRALWRNEMRLYNRACALCKKGTLSMYHPETPYTIYCADCWASDRWDPSSYAQNYDPNKSFFDQFNQLLQHVPKAGIFASSDIGPNINSEYTNFAGGNKDCYLIFNSGPRCENCAYSRGLIRSRDTFDAYYGDDLEQTYETINTHKSARIAWGQNVSDCVDSWFLLNCVGCQNCFGCVNLRQKSYHVLNQPLSLKEYEERIAKILGSRTNIERFKKEFEEFSLRFPRRENQSLRNVNVSGDYIFESKNCHSSFELSFCEDSRYLFSIKHAKDVYDLIGHGRQSELLLEGVAVGSSRRVVGSWWTTTSHDIEYSFGLRSCEYCFGCDSLRGSKYSLLNKEYSKEEYTKLRTRIVEELRSQNIYGLYFPPEIAPFAYNETIAQDNLPLTKEEAPARGFRWQDDLQMTTGKETRRPEEIPDRIDNVTDSILKNVLACIECGRNYKLIPAELQFYRQMLIPIPHKCFYCRHVDRIRKRGPMKLFDRTCDKCKKPIKTNFAPGRPEIVYCESCYQAEVI